MKYRLVIQWPIVDDDGFTRLLEVEDRLLEEISDLCDIDGHDIGAGEMNIFIDTDRIDETFSRVREMLEHTQYWTDIRAAYRKMADTKYTILWPPSLLKFQVA